MKPPLDVPATVDLILDLLEKEGPVEEKGGKALAALGRRIGVKDLEALQAVLNEMEGVQQTPKLIGLVPPDPEEPPATSPEVMDLLMEERLAAWGYTTRQNGDHVEVVPVIPERETWAGAFVHNVCQWFDCPADVWGTREVSPGPTVLKLCARHCDEWDKAWGFPPYEKPAPSGLEAMLPPDWDENRVTLALQVRYVTILLDLFQKEASDGVADRVERTLGFRRPTE